MKHQRLLSIDFLRGLAIVVLVIIHRMHYHWGGMSSHESMKEQMSGPLLPVLIFLIVLLSMAGLFYFLTGIVNAYAIQVRITQGKTRWQKALFFGISGGLWLVFLNYVQRLFFMNGFFGGENGISPEYPVGYLTGWIRDPEQVHFYWQQVTEPGTLSLIGLLVLLVSFLTAFLMHYRNRINLLQMQGILLVLALAALVASVFVKLHVTPLYELHFARGHYLKAALLGHICKDFSLFPYLGYAIIGSAVGLSLASGEKKEKVFRKCWVTALGLIVTGILIYLLFDKDKFGGRGTLGAMASLAELGVFMLFLVILLKAFDYLDKDKQQKRKKQTVWIRRFGMLSLTVFILEPVLAEILKKGIDCLAGNSWSNHFFPVLVFSGFCLFVWHLILRGWQKIGFVGSLEWLTAWVLLKLTKKKSGKVNFSELY
jgi:hypothetical protein